MPERNQRRLGGFPLAAIILVGLDILFLLQNLDVLPWELWADILRF